MGAAEVVSCQNMPAWLKGRGTGDGEDWPGKERVKQRTKKEVKPEKQGGEYETETPSWKWEEKGAMHAQEKQKKAAYVSAPDGQSPAKQLMKEGTSDIEGRRATTVG